MASPRIEIEIEGTKHVLYFGMVAVRIFGEKSVEETQRLAIANPGIPVKDLKCDSLKAFAYIVHGGLCNAADIEEVQRPLFPESYEVAEAIVLGGEEVQNLVWNTYNDSRATKDMYEKLGIEKKSEADPEKSPALIG